MSSELKYAEGGTPGMLIRTKSNAKKPIETFRVILDESRKPPMNKISSPSDAVNTVREMEDFDREHVKILHLDKQNRVSGIEETSIGALDSAIVHPRETLKGALLNNSASIMFIHNHPSGGCVFSSEDRQVYQRLKTAFELVGVSLLDGIVIGKECYSSMAEHEDAKTFQPTTSPASQTKGTQSMLRVGESKHKSKKYKVQSKR